MQDRHPRGADSPARVPMPARVGGGSEARVLFLTCHLPWPPVSGGRRRELELIKRLAGRFDVHLAVVSKTFGEDRGNAAALAPWCRRVEVFEAERPERAGDDRRELCPKVVRHRCAAAGARVAEILDAGVDLVHVEGFYLMQHLPRWVTAPVLLVEQNIEYELERQRAAVAAPVTRLGDFAAWMSTHRAERAAWRRADALGAVTAEDRELIARAAPTGEVSLLPDGADHVPTSSAERAPLARRGRSVVVMLANFAYGPNVDAAGHLAGEIMPRVRRSAPDVELWLVGNEPPAEIKRLADRGVRVTGRVPDVVPYLDAADVVVVPLRIGGGIKVKSIEALRRGKAIVSTTIGAQGMGPDSDGAMVIADSAEAFADSVARVLCDQRLRARLERRAAVAARKLPSWDDAAAAVASVYERLERGVRRDEVLSVAGRSR